jgi:DNA-binding NarL/FixJ family response regulator
VAADNPVRVVIVDDHSIFRSGLRADLDNSIEVVGEAADTASAVAVIEATRPDVVLLDVHLPSGQGAAAPEAAGGEAVIRAAASPRARRAPR